MTDRVVWTYFVSRDSLAGDLSGVCGLWIAKPTRVKHGSRVVWVATDEREPGHLGDFRTAKILQWFRTYPETDRELVRVETYPTKADLERAAKEQTK